MKISTSFFLTSLVAASALTVSAQQTANITLSPAPGDYETLPTEFVVTVEGPASISKNVLGGNPMLITAPTGETQQLTGTYDGNTITCKISATSTLPLDAQGAYTVAIRKDAIKYNWEDGSSTKSVLTEFTYNVAGTGGETPDEPQDVVYDIQMIKTTPSLTPLDIQNKTIETLQLYFDKGDLELAEDAMVTISGPNYRQSAPLLFNMKTETTTCFKAFFEDPEYSGTYTLTIPEGVLGDKEWIADHQYGHANAAVNYEFTVEGGKDPSQITQDLTFNPISTPSIAAKVSNLDKVTLLFESTPYWNEETELEVGYKGDLQALQYSSFTTATIEKGNENEVVLVFAKPAANNGEYAITIPEGTFWNEEHEKDENAGSLNGEMNLHWMFVAAKPEVNVTGHTPATDAKVEAFLQAENAIIINTDNNDAVAALEFTVVAYSLVDDTAAPETIIETTTSTDKTDDGALCWVNNTGADINLSEENFYEVSYSLLDSDGEVLADGLFEFYGAYTSGINSIGAEKNVNIVYNIQGIRVNSDTNYLPAGLYIINGKKTLISK